MATYKIHVDMAAALEHLAKRRGITTLYDDLSPVSRAARTMVANKSRSREREREMLLMMQKGHQTSIETLRKVSL